MELLDLQHRIFYKFKASSLLEEALTHQSFTNEAGHVRKNYERLEFLGDAVLELVITETLVKKYPKKSEGDLSKARSSLVKEDILVSVAKKIGLGEYVKLGKGEEISGGRERKSILACAMEALLAAVYLDGGYVAAYELIDRFWKDAISNVFTEEFDTDYKTKLQEFVQSKYKEMPMYKTLKITGPAHSRVFKVKVEAGDTSKVGEGNSKKEAEQDAASKAFKSLTEQGK
ncbi:MAG: ribonuclease III [Pseudomonadota bacterium]